MDQVYDTIESLRHIKFYIDLLSLIKHQSFCFQSLTGIEKTKFKLGIAIIADAKVDQNKSSN